jgi:hypothetical protein
MFDDEALCLSVHVYEYCDLNNAVFLRDRIVLQLSGFGICGCGKFRV